MKFRKEIAAIVIVGSVFCLHALSSAFFKPALPVTGKFHTPKEITSFREERVMDPIEEGEYFLTASNCRGCHGYDSTGYANVDYNGVSINVFDDWESTMMANSSKDPFWRAKVSHEILVNPSHSLELQNKCTSCHAPMGHYSSKFKGNLYYTIADLLSDSLGLEGVGCLSCHMIGDEQLGTVFSGNIPYDTTHAIYGPFQNPNTGPMQLYIGMTPLFSTHVSEGKMCSSCHTLIVNSVDLNGIPTGRSFVEQATYHEWLNSNYALDNISCQSCHMPKVLDSIRIANDYFNLPPRSPFNRHKFQGSNDFMIKLLKQNKAALDIDASDKNFDSTIAITKRMLQQNTLSLNLEVDSMTSDTAFFSLRLINKAGHKFPSGYPSRRAVVQLIAVGMSGDTIFQSGVFDPDYEVRDIDPVFEPHYDVISSGQQAQIYEMVMGDVTGAKTTVLERADSLLKDNRLVPEGFTSASPQYDTIKLAGEVLQDPNFNRFPGGGPEGSGRDHIYYHVPIAGYTSAFNVYAHVYYQAVPPGWLTEMFSHSSAEIDAFETMYNNADRSPVLVASDTLLQIAVGLEMPDWDKAIRLWPDPTSDGRVNIGLPEGSDIYKIDVYTVSGQLVRSITGQNDGNHAVLELPAQNGTYIVDIYFDNHRALRKVIRN